MKSIDVVVAPRIWPDGARNAALQSSATRCYGEDLLQIQGWRLSRWAQRSPGARAKPGSGERPDHNDLMFFALLATGGGESRTTRYDAIIIGTGTIGPLSCSKVGGRGPQVA